MGKTGGRVKLGSQEGRRCRGQGRVMLRMFEKAIVLCLHKNKCIININVCVHVYRE